MYTLATHMEGLGPSIFRFFILISCHLNLCQHHLSPAPTSHADMARASYLYSIDSGLHSLGLGPTNLVFFYGIYSTLSTPPACYEPTNMPHTHQIMTTPPPHDPNAHVADVEDAEKRFHVLATPSEVLSASDDVAGTWKCFSVSSTSAKYLYTPSLHCATTPINQEAQEWGVCVKVQ